MTSSFAFLASLCAAIALVVTGCGGNDYQGGIVIAKTSPNAVTIAWCRHRAKLSDYILNATYRVSEEHYANVEIGEYEEFRHEDEIHRERNGGCP